MRSNDGDGFAPLRHGRLDQRVRDFGFSFSLFFILESSVHRLKLRRASRADLNGLTAEYNSVKVTFSNVRCFSPVTIPIGREK